MTCSTDHMAFFHPNFMLQDDQNIDHHPSTSLPPILTNSCTPQEYHGVASLLGKRSSMSFSTGIDVCEEMNNINNNNHGEDELSDDGSQLGEKKRRLNMEQVKTLEKNFELGNKLEPERKMQLARALGLQPRQVAIWFQNRRARWKTKQLEKDYEILKRQFEAVKAENDALQTQNQKLHAEILTMKSSSREPTGSINLNKLETEGSCSNRSENSSEIKLDISRTPAIDSPLPNRASLLFPPPSSIIRPSSGGGGGGGGGVAQQLFQNSAAGRPEIPCPKILDQSTHHHHHVVKEESSSSLCNMFCGMDDQTGFWPWLDQQHFN